MIPYTTSVTAMLPRIEMFQRKKMRRTNSTPTKTANRPNQVLGIAQGG